MDHKFTEEELRLIESDLPEHWFPEEGYLDHPIGDRLEKNANGGYTLYRQDSFPDLKSAFKWLNEENSPRAGEEPKGELSPTYKDLLYVLCVLVKHLDSDTTRAINLETALAERGYGATEARKYLDRAYHVVLNY